MATRKMITLNSVVLFVLVLFVAFGSVPASAQSLCDARFLETAAAADVQRLVDQGADANGVCGNGNRPLHQALLPTVHVSSDVIRTLIDAGADVFVESVDAQTAVELSEARYEEAVSDFQAQRITLVEFTDKQAIYAAVNAAVEALSSAHQNLCDTNWWRSATGQSMSNLLGSAPEIDPNTVCNSGNDRPLHIALRPVEPLSRGNVNAIGTFVFNTDADFQARNRSNETPASLSEIRYDQLRARVIRDLNELCQNVTQVTVDRYNRSVDQYHEPEGSMYTYLRSTQGEPRNAAMQRMNRDFFGNPQGLEDVYQTCEYHRNR